MKQASRRLVLVAAALAMFLGWQVRAQNLITNGSGELMNNQNFSQASFDPTDFVTGGGSFKLTADGWPKLHVDEAIAIDSHTTYKFEFYIRCTVPNNYIYTTIYCYDVDGNTINAKSIMFMAGTTTTLAQNLNPGDTVVHLTDASAWTDSDKHYRRGFKFWNYTNSLGYMYPPETYSQRYYDDMWDHGVGAVDQANNKITLRTAWAGRATAAGTSISQQNSGGTYLYVERGEKGSEWTKCTAYLKPSMVRPGTVFVRPGWCINNTNAPGNTVCVNAVNFSPVPTDMISENEDMELGSSATDQTLSLHSTNLVLDCNYDIRWKDTSGTEIPTLRLDSSNDFRVMTKSGRNLIFGNGTDEVMRLDSSGNLLVGTTSQYDSETLGIDGDITIAGRAGSNDEPLGQLGFYNTYDEAQRTIAVIKGLRGDNTFDNGQLAFVTAQGDGTLAEAFRVDSAQRVLIGTTSKYANEVLGVAGQILSNDSVRAPKYLFYHDAGNPQDATPTLYNQTGLGPTISGPAFAVRTGNPPVETLRLDGAGRLGLGRKPTSVLDVAAPDSNGSIAISKSALKLEGTDHTLRAGVDNTNACAWVQGYQVGGVGPTDLVLQPSAGNLGIGCTPPNDAKLAVEGTINARKVVVNSTWADHVFGDDYKLTTLAAVERHIAAKGRLPNMPSAAEIEKDGLDLGAVAVQQQVRLEENTLHLIELKKENAALKARLARLERLLTEKTE